MSTDDHLASDDAELNKDRFFVTALARGLAVLAAFRPGEAALSNQELTRRTGLPKSTVSRLTYTLTQLGYLSQEADTGYYRLGLAVLALGSAVLSSYDVREVAAPLMREFALRHNVSVSLAMRDGVDMVYLETCRSAARVTVQLTVGSRVPLVTTAIGRAYYAGLSAAERAKLDLELAERYGPEWPGLSDKLAESLADYRDHGYTHSWGEYGPEVLAIGVPLRSPASGQPTMALNASGPALLFTPDALGRDVGPALVELAHRIAPPVGG
ncbi:IclR family transcriptional regulator [Crenobacter luteus]|uniref:AsnC family transcriptional regulator n=1 Tax=Crenobacter luteus TaxID=1452487 RepID=A0A165F1I0_9NEIS|nr:IclR family transcriptional regulator [Crenobacter luteus]KZE29709.1 AsnC family transcriptional regulator [Crenobacter luteus]TCP11858.1 IclR family transcriptional regulator [Crenobacter luteus]